MNLLYIKWFTVCDCSQINLESLGTGKKFTRILLPLAVVIFSVYHKLLKPRCHSALLSNFGVSGRSQSFNVHPSERGQVRSVFPCRLLPVGDVYGHLVRKKPVESAAEEFCRSHL